MKGTGDQPKGKPRDSARVKTTRGEVPTDQSNAELRSYHKIAADILVGLNERDLNPDDPCERLALASLGAEGEFDKRHYRELLKAAPVEQQTEILADADSLHWRLAPVGPDWVSRFIFWSYYRSPDAGSARFKAVHGLPKMNRREAIEFLSFANEVAENGNQVGKALLADLMIGRIKEADSTFFAHIGEALERPQKEVSGSHDTPGSTVERKVFLKFCELYISDGKLPTKAEVRKGCDLGGVGTDESSALKLVSPAFTVLEAF